jgi:hypothetical protein
MVNHHAPLRIEDEVVLDARQREIAAEFAAMVDGGGCRREDFDHDNQINEENRVVRELGTADDRAIRRVDCSLIDLNPKPAGEDLAITTGAA